MINVVKISLNTLNFVSFLDIEQTGSGQIQVAPIQNIFNYNYGNAGILI